MKSVVKFLTAGLAAIGAMGLATSIAQAGERPPICYYDHDHRAHQADYYDFYAADRFSRAGPYRGSAASVTLSFGDRGFRDRRFDDRRFGDRRFDNRGFRDRRFDDRGFRGQRFDGRRGGRVISRDVIDTRWRARIVLTEVAYGDPYRGRGRLICNVSVRGPEARFVPYRRLNQVASNRCSPRSRVVINA